MIVSGIPKVENENVGQVIKRIGDELKIQKIKDHDTDVVHRLSFRTNNPPTLAKLNNRD